METTKIASKIRNFEDFKNNELKEYQSFLLEKIASLITLHATLKPLGFEWVVYRAGTVTEFLEKQLKGIDFKQIKEVCTQTVSKMQNEYNWPISIKITENHHGYHDEIVISYYPPTC